jgi:O-succinylbenzoic acid--CoA ligase
MLLPLFTIPLAADLARRIAGGVTGRDLNPMLKRTGQLLLAFGVLLTIGVALSSNGSLMHTTAFPDWVASRSSSNPDRTALVSEGRAWSFAQLDADVTRLARQLASFGVVHGDRIATLLHNSATAAILPHALLRLGATLVPLNVRLSPAEIEWQIADASPRLVIVGSRTRSLAGNAGDKVVDVEELNAAQEVMAELRMEHDGDSVLAIIYTSGTTGQPKGAMLTVSNFWWSAIGSALNLGTRDDDRWIACLPLFHVGGLSIVIRAAIYGITAVVQDGFDAAAVNADIDDNGATIVSVVSVMLDRMIEQRGSDTYPSTLRCVLLGGGPAPAPLLQRCGRLGIPVVQTYGLTETCSQVATLSPEEAQHRLGSAGKPLYPNAVRIDTGNGGEGEILVRGPIVMSGYLDREDATTKTIVDGWLHTGDIGRIDADGFLYVLDRRDDLIITGGENVYPAEVEAVLLGHGAVTEAAVVGIADEKWGQRVVAFIVSPTPIDTEELAAHCRLYLAGYKVPGEFRFLSDPLPRTASGKIRRVALRETL